MNDQDYIAFEGYISKTFSEEEIADFEIRLEQDQDFKQAFKTYKELHSFLEQKFENIKVNQIIEITEGRNTYKKIL